jgi:hypothetical protein
MKKVKERSHQFLIVVGGCRQMEIVERQGHLPEKEPDGVSPLISLPSEAGRAAHCVAHQADETKDASKSGSQAPDRAGDTMTLIPENRRHDTSSDAKFEGIGDNVIAENIIARRELERSIGTPEHLELVAALKREFPEIYEPSPKFAIDE